MTEPTFNTTRSWEAFFRMFMDRLPCECGGSGTNILFRYNERLRRNEEWEYPCRMCRREEAIAAGNPNVIG